MSVVLLLLGSSLTNGRGTRCQGPEREFNRAGDLVRATLPAGDRIGRDVQHARQFHLGQAKPEPLLLELRALHDGASLRIVESPVNRRALGLGIQCARTCRAAVKARAVSAQETVHADQ